MRVVNSSPSARCSGLLALTCRAYGCSSFMRCMLFVSGSGLGTLSLRSGSARRGGASGMCSPALFAIELVVSWFSRDTVPMICRMRSRVRLRGSAIALSVQPLSLRARARWGSVCVSRLCRSRMSWVSWGRRMGLAYHSKNPQGGPGGWCELRLEAYLGDGAE